MKFVLVTAAILIHLACSMPVPHPDFKENELCAADRLVTDAACHCFIATSSNSLHGPMAKYCHEGFGKHLNKLAPTCRAYINENGSLDVEHYKQMYSVTRRVCFQDKANSLVRQFITPSPGFQYVPPPDNPYGFEFQKEPISPIPGIHDRPINVGGINLLWEPFSSGTPLTATGYGSSLSYDTDDGFSSSFPIPGTDDGKFSFDYNPDGDKYQFGVHIPF